MSTTNSILRKWIQSRVGAIRSEPIILMATDYLGNIFDIVNVRQTGYSFPLSLPSKTGFQLPLSTLQDIN